MPSHAKRRSSTPRNGRVIYLHPRAERGRRDDEGNDDLPNPRLSKGKGRKGGRRGMAGQTTVNCAPPEGKAKDGRGMNKWLGILITGSVSALGAILAYRAYNRMSGANAQAEIVRAQNNPLALSTSTMNPVTANAMNMLMATSASPATNQQIAMNAMQIQQAQLLEQSKLQLMALEAQSKLNAAPAPKKRKKKNAPQMAPSLDALLQGSNDDDDDEDEDE